MRQQYIEFSVNHQIIERVDSFRVVGGSKNYLKARFSFCSDWAGETVTAVFCGGGVTKRMIVVDGECDVPWEVLAANAKQFYVSCFAGSMITSNPAAVEMLPGGPTNAAAGKKPTPSEYEQLIKRVEYAVAIAERAAQTAAEDAAQAFVDKAMAYIDEAVSKTFAEKAKAYIDNAIAKAMEEIKGSLLSPDMIATDEEVKDMNSDVWNSDGSGGGCDCGGEGSDPDEDIATDEEVGDVVDDIFAPESGGTTPDDEIATDEEVGDVVDDVFGTGTESAPDEETPPDAEETTPEDEIASDEEVNDLITDIFG